MSFNFSANQFENEFHASRLCNFEVPKWKNGYHPQQRIGSTKVIANDRGHLLPEVKRADKNPWGYYKNTWQLPDKISKKYVEEYNRPLIKYKSICEKECKPGGPLEQKPRKYKTAKSTDLEYIPGDFSDPRDRYVDREFLLKAKQEREQNITPELNEDYLEKHNCTDPYAIVQKELKQPEKESSTEPHILAEVLGENVENNLEKMRLSMESMPKIKVRQLFEKPNERNPEPVVPAYTNFQVAKKMHQENLDHQPLPDCVSDPMFRKLQAAGHPFPGLGIDNIDLQATGVGIKTHNVGPTHCTKLKIFRPKTTGMISNTAYQFDANGHLNRPHSTVVNKKMGLMDLAICWDLHPFNPADEPKRTKHIDGSNGCAAPAVFTLVKTPRDDVQPVEPIHSGGVFSNTFGETDFFDRNILKNKQSFTQQNNKEKCTCGTSPIQSAALSKNNSASTERRSKSSSAKDNAFTNQKRCKSSPNLSRMLVSEFKENDIIEQYNKIDSTKRRNHTCSKYGPKNDFSNQQTNQPSLFRRTTRLCHKVAPEPQPLNNPTPKQNEEYKPPFKAGVPKSNATGTISSFDSGCSTMSSSTCSTKVLVVPRPKDPYSKKKYNINTLVPPFLSVKGGQGQGGYPEHWRLASVYQHAYKPIEQRKRPLLETVFK